MEMHLTISAALLVLLLVAQQGQSRPSPFEGVVFPDSPPETYSSSNAESKSVSSLGCRGRRCGGQGSGTFSTSNSGSSAGNYGRPGPFRPPGAYSESESNAKSNAGSYGNGGSVSSSKSGSHSGGGKTGSWSSSSSSSSSGCGGFACASLTQSQSQSQSQAGGIGGLSQSQSQSQSQVVGR